MPRRSGDRRSYGRHRPVTVDDATERLLRAHEYTNERGYATAEVVSEPYVEAGQIQVPIEV